MDQQKLTAMQAVLQHEIDANEIAGANVLVLQNGEEQCYYERGYADIAQKLPIKRDSIFRLYSMTKPITAAAMMILMERGLVDLLDPVFNYLPGFKNQHIAVDETTRIPVTKPATLRDLLSMTSGLSYGNPDTPAGREAETLFAEVKAHAETPQAVTTVQLANQIGACGLAFQPGEHWMYGSSADVLGAVIEVVSGMKFGEFLQKEFFEPLGMHDTSFGVTDEKRTRLANVYEATETGLKEYTKTHLGITNSMAPNPAFESGGAGLASTIDDYSKFAQMLLNQGTFNGKQILSPKTVEYFTTCHLNAQQQRDMKDWDGLVGYSYGNLMRVMVDPGLAIQTGTKGEYGWDGWLGVYFFNDPVHKLTFLMMVQRKDAGTLPFTRRLRNIAFSAL